MDFDSIALTDLLAEPTEERHFAPTEETQFNASAEDFEQNFFEENPPIEEIEPEEPYDAQTEATKLVGLLNAGNSLLLTPLGQWKLKKNRGGKAVLERLKVSYLKKQRGEKLSEKDLQNIAEFEAYKSDIALLNGEIPFSEQEIQNLITCAIPYCESTKMKINSGFAFWGVYAGLQTSKIIKILQA